MGRTNNFKGITYAVLSSSTFGLSPFFTLLLIGYGLSSFDVLFYRWGIAALALGAFGVATGHSLRVGRRDIGALLMLGLLRAITSFSLIIAYQNIATGVASSIHFLYPLAVAIGMAIFFREHLSWKVGAAIVVSLVGAILLSMGDMSSGGENALVGVVAACVSFLSYGAYIIGVRKSRAAQMDSTALTFYVMAFGAVLFGCCGFFTTGEIELVTDWKMWLCILGLALPATAISNITLVKAIKYIGPTMSSLLGAMEPLTAMVIGVLIFGESFTLITVVGVVLVIAAVSSVVLRAGDTSKKEKAPLQEADAGGDQ